MIHEQLNDRLHRVKMSSMRALKFPEREDLSLHDVLYALSDPTRLCVVRSLALNSEQTCGSCDLGIAKSTMSHHFKVLREAGIIHMRPCGTSYLNSLRREDLDARFPGLLDAVLRAADGI